MNKAEKGMLKDFIDDFKIKEEKRKLLRGRIVKALDKIEMELYDDKDSSNEGLLTRVNNLEDAVKEIANLVRRTKIRNEVIIGILSSIMLAVLSALVNPFINII